MTSKHARCLGRLWKLDGKQLADTVRSMGRVPVAFVRPENGRSMNAFRKSGFNFVDTLVELQAHGRDGRE
jgi:hypothetical protein